MWRLESESARPLQRRGKDLPMDALPILDLPVRGTLEPYLHSQLIDQVDDLLNAKAVPFNVARIARWVRGSRTSS
jgi:hypothetical protein